MRLGIDIGGTKTAALVLDDTGTVVARASAPSGRGNTQTLRNAYRGTRELLGFLNERHAGPTWWRASSTI